jgi:hypothetical protein
MYNHRHVDFTTATNTVTSSGFPPKIKRKNNIIFLSHSNVERDILSVIKSHIIRIFYLNAIKTYLICIVERV